jgi:hypothetical protein
MPRHVPRPIELDLARAVRAELSVEYWGGHIGTSGQQFQVNSNGWVEYDDFDWDGNGVWREWQFTTHHGVLQHHLGTATNAPWRVRFDARWLPYQSQPVRVRARITDATGLVWLTPPVENLVQKRERRSVRMCKPVNVPENFCSRDSKSRLPARLLWMPTSRKPKLRGWCSRPGAPMWTMTASTNCA